MVHLKTVPSVRESRDESFQSETALNAERAVSVLLIAVKQAYKQVKDRRHACVLGLASAGVPETFKTSVKWTNYWPVTSGRATEVSENQTCLTKKKTKKKQRKKKKNGAKVLVTCVTYKQSVGSVTRQKSTRPKRSRTLVVTSATHILLWEF